MKPALRILLVAALLAIIATAGLLGMRRFLKTSLASQKLADGSVLTLHRVVVGTRHIDPFARVSEQIIAQLPEKWVTRLGWKSAARFQPGPTNFASLWFTDTRLAGSPPNSRQLKVFIGDGQGSWTGSHLYSTLSSTLRDGRWAEAVGFQDWPRRATNLIVHVRNESDDKFLAEFTVPNPAPDRTTPKWTASPLPVVQTNGSLEFALTGLHVGHLEYGSRPVPARSSAPQAVSPEAVSVLSTYRVSQGGQVLTNWEAYHVESVSDATGNVSDGNSWSRGVEDGAVWNRFDRFPLPVGEAWRIRTRFSRIAGFAPEELWEARGVPVTTNRINQNWTPPKQGAPPDTNHITGRIGPVTVSVGFLGLPSWSQDANMRQVSVSLSPGKEDHRLTLVRAQDDQGRVLVGAEDSSSGDTVTFRITVHPDSKTVDLTLAHHLSRYAEFLAEPSLVVATNTAARGPDGGGGRSK